MLNKYIAIGNLTAKPKVQQVKDTQLTTFSVAVNNPMNKNDVCFIDIETWGKTAQNCSKFLDKGSKIFLEGRLKYSCWQSKDGSKKCKVSCVADYVQFMNSNKEESNNENIKQELEVDEELSAEEFDELSDIPF